MDEDLRKAMQAKWEASQQACPPAEQAGPAPESEPENVESGPKADEMAQAAKAKQQADFEAYRREMAERYARTGNAFKTENTTAVETQPVSSASGAPEPTTLPTEPPKSPRTAARELREQQDREFQEALAADQAASGDGPPLGVAPAPSPAPAAAPVPSAESVSQEEDLRRRQIAELRARRAGASADASTSAATGADSSAAARTETMRAGMVRDDVTGDVRPAEAQGRVQRLTDDLPGGMNSTGGRDMGAPGGVRFPGGGMPGTRPELPPQVRQALTESQLELLYEAMGEVGGGFPMLGGMPGGMGALQGGMPEMPGPPQMSGMAMGVMPGRRAPPPFAGGFDDDEGTPSNWDPRNARQTSEEQEIHRRQVAELRARAGGQAPPSADVSGTDAAQASEASSGQGMVRDDITGETRPAAAQGRLERLAGGGPSGGMPGIPGGGMGGMPPGMPGTFNPFGGGPQGGFPGLPGADDMPMTLREMAMREQDMEGYGRPGMGGGMPPWAQFGREPEGYEELSAISERIGDVSRGVPVATIEQNSFTFDFEPPAPDSEIAQQASNDPTLARCSVCLCDLEQGECCRRLPCLHMFHKDCIDDWLKKNRSCPVCKTDIVTGASETRQESGQAQCSAAAMPGEPDFQPPGWGDELGPASGMPGGYGLGPPRQQRRQAGVGFGGAAAAGPVRREAGAGTMGGARGYFDRGPRLPSDDDGPPPGIFGAQVMPPPEILESGGGGVGASRGARMAQAAAAAAEARAAASAAMEGDDMSGASGTVVDSVTGEARPSNAQGRVERLDGDQGDLWRGMQGMGISGGGYQAQGRGAYPYGSRGPSTNPYYEQMFRSRGPLGAIRQRGPAPAGATAQQPAGFGGASNAATLRGAANQAAGDYPAGVPNPSVRGMGPLGGPSAEQLLVQARMQQQMAMQAMGQGAMSERRPQAGATDGPREWNHFFQGR